jgi:hypothetical protein
MVLINPRRTKATIFWQTLVAVLSGCAAMYCIQNVGPDPVPRLKAAWRKALVAPEPVRPSAPAPARPQLPPPAQRLRKDEPAKNSMLVVAEPGGARAEMVAAGFDSP